MRFPRRKPLFTARAASSNPCPKVGRSGVRELGWQLARLVAGYDFNINFPGCVIRRHDRYRGRRHSLTYTSDGHTTEADRRRVGESVPHDCHLIAALPCVFNHRRGRQVRLRCFSLVDRHGLLRFGVAARARLGEKGVGTRATSVQSWEIVGQPERAAAPFFDPVALTTSVAPLADRGSARAKLLTRQIE